MPKWSDVKAVWRNLQRHKCAFCERPLPEEFGALEVDVEHFRPKAECSQWGSRSGLPAPQFDFPVHVGRSGGYYWLAYDPWNYCATCKTCNSPLKGTRFPILGATGNEGDRAATLLEKEIPVLPYPVGDMDDDPEDLVAFTGLVAGPKGNQQQRQRGQATVEFLQLNGREDLKRGRATQLVSIWAQLVKERAGDDDAKQEVDDALVSTRRPFASCVRSFIRLARADWARAEKLYAAVHAYHRSVGDGAR